ncbi:MAG: hypothetical protein ACYC7A_20825 [Thermoanaerobaculia bacterium]
MKANLRNKLISVVSIVLGAYAVNSRSVTTAVIILGAVYFGITSQQRKAIVSPAIALGLTLALLAVNDLWALEPSHIAEVLLAIMLAIGLCADGGIGMMAPLFAATSAVFLIPMSDTSVINFQWAPLFYMVFLGLSAALSIVLSRLRTRWIAILLNLVSPALLLATICVVSPIWLVNAAVRPADLAFYWARYILAPAEIAVVTIIGSRLLRERLHAIGSHDQSGSTD